MPHQPGHRQRRDPELAPRSFAFGDPDDVVLGQGGAPFGEVEHLLDGRRDLALLGVGLVVAAGHRTQTGPRRVPDPPAGLDHRRIGILHAFERGRVERDAQAVGRLEELEAQVVVEVDQGPLGHPIDQHGTQLTRGGPGHPGRQFVGLVDDHRVVLGQGGLAVHGVDGQQRVVGDHQVGRAGHVP